MIRRLWEELWYRAEHFFASSSVVIETSLRAAWHFVCNWAVSRSYREFLWALPAIIALLCVILVLVARRPSSAELALRYRDSAVRAQHSQDAHGADLWLAKVALLAPDEPSHLYSLARISEQDGRLDRARQIMQRIAPEQERGYPDAHLWLARDLAQSKSGMSPKSKKSLQHHLTHALRSPRESSDAHRMLGLMLLQDEQLDQALPHLEAAAASRPDVRVRLGQVHAMRGERAKAVAQWRTALAEYSQIVREWPADTDSRLYLAECNILLGRLDDAEEVLRASATDQKPRILQKLIAVHLTKFDRFLQQDRARPEKALALLLDADELDPNNPQVLNRMSQLADISDATRDMVRQLLQRRVAKGESPANVRFVLGVIAAAEGEFETATYHYERSLAQGSATMVLMNNLAWSLANSNPPDLNRALQLVEKSLQMAPHHPLVMDTRGQILAKLGRWNDCIADLEKALPALADRAPVHDTLALAYEKIQLPEVAQLHRLKAEQWRDGH